MLSDAFTGSFGESSMIDFDVGWRAVPGMFGVEDATTLRIAVERVPDGQSVVELGAWCGRSLAVICEALPRKAVVYSFDNYQENSQTNVEESPITPSVARKLRQVVGTHFRGNGKDVRCVVHESADAGDSYRGPPVSVLFIDDHHSAEQLQKNFAAWLPHLASQATILLHDYTHPTYQLADTAVRMLPPAEFRFIGVRGIVGIWSRGYA